MSTAEPYDLEASLPRLGLASFRLGQREVISALLAGKDCLCIMPTGGGKSLCYQLPAIIRPGVVLVISPLIALMKDQVDSLVKLGVQATFINSSVDPTQQSSRLERLAAGQYDLMFVAPERFRSPRFIAALESAKVQLLAVDEAHCISEWGHDFRPDYARLGWFRRRLGNPQTIALTATATPRVREDVVEQLQLDCPEVFIAGFSRPNLRYEVETTGRRRDKEEVLLKFLTETPGCGIIYASSRRRCAEIAETLRLRTSRKAGVYHAGLMPDERCKAQDEFMSGGVEVVVATNAFGMGIDKPDVRFVVHYNMPGTLEAYYQEAGRAGRDGRTSRCLLLFSPSDRYIQEFFIESSYPSRDMVARVYDYLRTLDDDPIELTQEQLKERLGLPITADGVGTCEQLLEKCGALERLEARQNMAAVRLNSDLPTLVDLLPPRSKVGRQIVRAVEQRVADRRHELVYFHPRDLAESVGLELETVNRTLRSLRSFDAFDYIPPFRGRALRVLKRDSTLDELGIDFDAIQGRRNSEYEKLNRVIRFAQSTNCRQTEILRYFGEQDGEACGTCDNCRRAKSPPASGTSSMAHTGDGTMLPVVRMVLSGVARTHGRFGKQIIAQMLCGSRSAKVSKWKLDRLSTFGLLSHLTQGEAVMLIDAILEIGLIEQTDVDRFRPVLNLTERGEDVVHGREPLAEPLELPDYLVSKLCRDPSMSPAREPTDMTSPQTLPDLPPANPVLLAALRQWRGTLADASGQKAYMVMTNATINLLARYRPTSLGQLESIKGIGQSKLERYGGLLLELISQNGPGAAGQREASLAGGKTSGGSHSSEAAPPAAPTGERATADPEALGDLDTAASAPKPTRTHAGDHAQESSVSGDETPTDHNSDGTNQDTASRGQVVRVDASDGKVRPSHYWTWRLLWSGFSADECAEIRGLDLLAIVDHALQAVESGLQVEARWLLSPAQMAAIERVIPPDSAGRIRPMLESLPPDIRYEHVQLFLKCRAACRKDA